MLSRDLAPSSSEPVVVNESGYEKVRRTGKRGTEVGRFSVNKIIILVYINFDAWFSRCNSKQMLAQQQSMYLASKSDDIRK